MISLHGYKDAKRHLLDVGFSRTTQLANVLRVVKDLIDTPQPVVVDTAVGEYSELREMTWRLARSAEDDRVKLAAQRTLYELDGLLGKRDLDPRERGNVMKELEEIAMRIRGKLLARAGGPNASNTPNASGMGKKAPGGMGQRTKTRIGIAVEIDDSGESMKNSEIIEIAAPEKSEKDEFGKA